MKNIENWKESKFTFKNGKLRASRNPKEVIVSSRMIVDKVAEFYTYALPKYAKGDLLDLGCGKVPFYLAYKDLVRSIFCVDWENSMHKNEFLDQHADLNQKLDLPSDAYDTLILSDVLEHIKKPVLLVEEMNRILRKDGILLMNVPFYYWIHEEPFDYHRYTRFALTEMAEDNGFEVLELDTLGGTPEILCDIFSKNGIKIPLIGKGLVSVIYHLIWWFTHTKVGKRFSHKTARKFPFGYTLVLRKVRNI